MPRHAPALLLLLPLTSLAATDPDEAPETVAPAAKVQTDLVPSEGDAADDPAIWIHPEEPALSLVLGSDKQGGLHAYGLDGRERQVISPESRPNNVDILYDFPLQGRDRPVDLAIASAGKGGRPGVKIWRIDRATGRLSEVGDGPTFPTFGGGVPYGLACYRSPRDGSAYVFVTDRDGSVEQHRLEPTAAGPDPIRATLVRSFRVGSQAEGIVADRERARLFIAEENVGIWEYGAEPEEGDARRSVARVGEHGLTADVEGLALYYAPEGRGYLLASSQGNDAVAVFERAGDHRHVLTIDPNPDALGDVEQTDGLEVTNERTSALFPGGLLVLQDGVNPGRQNFKLFSWEDIAGRSLLVDTTATARPVPTDSGPREPRPASQGR